MLALPSLAAIGLTIAMAIPTQDVSDAQLQRFIANATFPTGCGAARVASNTIRATSTINVKELRDAAAEFHACATGPYGTASHPVENVSNFAAAAASLLAARHEADVAEVHIDATHARVAAQKVIDYRRPPGASGVLHNPDPSQLITDAGRMKRDADALLDATLGATH